MASYNVDEVFLYKVPASVMCSFYEIMDSLDDTDWKKFASMIITDQTALRLLEQGHRRNRTQEIIWSWTSRNARLKDLILILRKLNLLRALNIFDCWSLDYVSKLAAAQNTHPAKEPSPPTRTLPSQDHSLCDKKKSPSTDTAPNSGQPLPLPGPPPSHLNFSSICPSQASSSESSRDSTTSNTRPSIQECLDTGGAMEPSKHLLWNFQEVTQGTRNFSQSFLIGEGGFGCVYKAVIRNTAYAIKRLKQDAELEWSTVKKSFQTEIEKLTCLRHPNIIDLAGYCMQGEEYCLIYLYLPNGSLEDRLHHQGSFPILTWKQRLSIMQGAACGIQFLHTLKPSIIHGDIKSSNILLDQALVAKLGDFGLARFSRYACDAGKSRTLARTSTVRGTLAYLPDEYVKLGKLTFELDTYSFGVVLLEILTGRKAVDNDSGSHTKYLKDIVNEEESDQEAEGSSPQGATSIRNAENKLFRSASRICRHHLDFRIGCCSAEVAQELCFLACRCLGRQKKRPGMVEVFNEVTRLQSLLLHASETEPSDVQSSFLSDNPDSFPPLLDLLSSLQPSVLAPQENTDKFTPYGTSIDAPALGSVRPYSQSALQYDDKLVDFCSISSCESLRTSRRTPNLPEESDDSVSVLSLAAASPDLACGHIPDQQELRSSPHTKALQCRSTVLATSDLNTSAGRGSSIQGNSSSASGDSQGLRNTAISMPHHQIIVNPAKQRFVEQLALYDQGKINSLELLYSGTSPDYYSEGRGYPEESDDFPS
ncbi:interleukin-1 receptor-associated kinase 1 isoform X1 [Ranitomeya variabilis]|uniref:interleukin-1 receptor-associated kinase 1 isoform X1 n=2 Tax=Ranitomeya variabilis TaxID=490064 RepID=UPI004057770A